MARAGFSASNSLRYAGAVLSNYPCSLSCWAYTSVTNADQALMGIYGSSTQSQIDMRAASDGKLHGGVQNNAGSNGYGVTPTLYPANSWFHAATVVASTTSQSVYLNGGGKNTNTTSHSPGTSDRTAIGFRDNTNQDRPFGAGGTGYLAEAAIWNIALSDADVAALALGLCPLLIHPEALVAYWPLLGSNSPENNLCSNSSTLAIRGSLTAAPHPRIFMPRRRIVRSMVAGIVAPSVLRRRTLGQRIGSRAA
jgi:hypothetical protein